MSEKFYTGVGSRQTPPEVLARMEEIAREMWGLGWTLRSGAAEGADEAFENGVRAGQGVPIAKEIFLPWPSFRGRINSLGSAPSWMMTSPSQEAMEIASDVHPAWHRLGQGAKKLHARNVHQVLGRDLLTPSLLLICWTPGGEDVGGTRTAIVLARRNGVEIVNLATQPRWRPTS